MGYADHKDCQESTESFIQREGHVVRASHLLSNSAAFVDNFWTRNNAVMGPSANPDGWSEAYVYGVITKEVISTLRGGRSSLLSKFAKKPKIPKAPPKKSSNPKETPTSQGMSQANTKTSNFNFGAYLRKEKGLPPLGMQNPHVHHVVVKEEFKNRNKMTQAYAEYSREVLRSYGIDPIKGLENLHWAPNKGHSNCYIKAVARELWELKKENATKEQIAEKLEWIAKQLRKDKIPPK